MISLAPLSPLFYFHEIKMQERFRSVGKEDLLRLMSLKKSMQRLSRFKVGIRFVGKPLQERPLAAT